jgi:NAD(P)-dependent dehydrogenase (short-subunit alcohol dehydrogenase family)
VILPGPTNRQLAEDRTAPIQILENQPLDWLGIPTLISRKEFPEDIAHAVAFFASDAAEYITEQSLHVSGGLFMP